MELIINGANMKVPSSIKTVTDLIDHLNLKSPVIIVEHNEKILQKDEHEHTPIEEGDKIEFVQFVGGG